MACHGPLDVSRVEPHVDEARAGDLGTDDELVVGRQRATRSRGDVARRSLQLARQLHRQVRREVAVLGLLRPRDLDDVRLDIAARLFAAARMRCSTRSRVVVLTSASLADVDLQAGLGDLDLPIKDSRRRRSPRLALTPSRRWVRISLAAQPRAAAPAACSAVRWIGAAGFPAPSAASLRSVSPGFASGRRSSATRAVAGIDEAAGQSRSAAATRKRERVAACASRDRPRCADRRPRTSVARAPRRAGRTGNRDRSGTRRCARAARAARREPARSRGWRYCAQCRSGIRSTL